MVRLHVSANTDRYQALHWNVFVTSFLNLGSTLTLY